MMRRVVPPLVLLVAVIGGWQMYCSLSGIDPLVVPTPAQVARQLGDDDGLLWSALLVTAREVLIGVGIGVLGGCLLATLIHVSPLWRRAWYPALVASQAVPFILLAPIFVIWLGFGIAPKVLTVALISFFPIVVSTHAALAAIDPQLPKLMRTLGASRLQVLLRVEAPAALPGLFSGARISVAVATVGAVFAEEIGNSGLGQLLWQATNQLEAARAFAIVLVLAAFTLLLFSMLTLLQRRLLPWTRS